MPLLDVGSGIGIALAILAGIGVLALVIWAAIRAHKANEERIRQIAAWAASRGFSFSRGRDNGLHSRYHFISHFDQGSNRYCQHIVRGTMDITAAKREGTGIPLGVNIAIFDFHFETYSTDSKGNRTTHHHWSSHCVIELPVRFRFELKIRPENFLDKIGGFVGFSDINFESDRFSRQYHVVATDRKFAYDVFHPLMMEYLLALGHVRMELDGSVLARTSPSLLKQPADYEVFLLSSTGIVEHLPGWLLQQHASG